MQYEKRSVPEGYEGLYTLLIRDEWERAAGTWPLPVRVDTPALDRFTVPFYEATYEWI